MDNMFSTILFGQCILVSFILTGLIRRFQRSKASSNINDSLVMFLFINMSLAQVNGLIYSGISVVIHKIGKSYYGSLDPKLAKLDSIMTVNK